MDGFKILAVEPKWFKRGVSREVIHIRRGAGFPEQRCEPLQPSHYLE